MHSMEEGGWDLSKVDKELMKESKAAFVFGQMNEPPGARARVALTGLTLAEYYYYYCTIESEYTLPKPQFYAVCCAFSNVVRGGPARVSKA